MQTNEPEPFTRTTAINMMLALKKRIKGVQGGTSAGKTFGILPILINKAIKNPGLEVSVVAESVPHLKRGAMKDFKKIMIKTKRWNHSNWHSTDSIYTFANGSCIEFFSADNDAKLRGARRDILYMNEANNMTLHAYNELASRTKQDVWMDWNPTSPFWFHEELKGDDDVDFLVINYTHNEACPPSAIDFILKAKEKAKTSKFWENWYNVYGLGEIGSLEGVIFSNWTIIDSIPNEAKIVNYGLDFGYTNDPTTIIYVGLWNGKIVLDELCYQTGMVNADIVRKAKETTDGFTYIIADSSEPKSIEEIKRGGIRIKGALKGRDSINFGIDTLQQFDMLVTSRSTNLIKELRNYCWDKDKEGKALNKPIDSYNHCFVGDTLILTNLGEKRIDEINVNDLVLTSEGYRKVEKKFNNGVKNIYKYLMLFDTFSIYLSCTSDHKIKTSKGWKCIKNLTANDILYIEMRNILVEEQKGCMLLHGSSTTEQYQRDFMFTTKMKTLGIMTSITSNLSKLKNTFISMQKSVLLKIQSLLNLFNRKELQLLQSGIKVKKAVNGIKNTQKNSTLASLIYQKKNAKHAIRNLNPKSNIQDFATIIVNQNIEDQLELITYKENVQHVAKPLLPINIQKQKLVDVKVVGSRDEKVYDLMIKDKHEYFANGVLVHNCIDAVRYAAESLATKKKFEWYVITE